MIVTIQPSAIQGNIQAPTSKSSMQRACAAALLTPGATEIFNPGKSNDDLAALDVIQKLGARVRKNKDGSLTIDSSGILPSAHEINCGESGLGIRMFTPIAALSSEEIVINGTGSLVTRPMDFFDEIFPKLGISIKSNNGRLPLVIKGPLIPRTIEVDGSLSSQFLTGLLMAFGAAGAKDVSIKVKDLKSKPYIDLTLQVMKQFGWHVENRNYEEFFFGKLADQTSVADEGWQGRYTVEGDWSGGAFLLVAAAIAGDITVRGLDVESTQADKAVMQALKSCGAKFIVTGDSIEVGPADLKAFHFDATHCPDLFPPLVALAAYCDGITVIEGVSRLAHKESNRSTSLQEEFSRMGVTIKLEGDKMMIHGDGTVAGAGVKSHHDHRIAMACAVAALKASGSIIIRDAEAINKSYPEFFEDIISLGANLRID
ncbi:MAG: 3-phosphoshikimate 1-carboxyvinyltransferase [Chitinophagaceae bacterium]